MPILDFIRKSVMNPAGRARKQLESRSIEFNEGSFLKAIQEGRFEDVSLFLEAGMNPAVRGDDGLSALAHAVKSHHAAVVTTLAKAGADVNAKDKEGRSVLVLSTLAHEEDTAKALVAAGANVDARDNAGLSVIMIAVIEGQLGIAEALINAGSDVNVKNHATGETALVMAAQRGNLAMVELLLKNAITSEDRDAGDKNGASPLWWAARNGHAEVVRLLCIKKANVNLANSAGQTPLQAAAGNETITAILKEFGAR